MIHIEPKPKPDSFDEQVRQPGLEYLTRVPHPTTKQFEKHAYWRAASDDLHALYGGICAYSCHWIPYDTGWRQVEHFKPKSKYPKKAYEWDNFRLVCGVLNGRKGVVSVLDPFKIENGWFIIEFPSLLVVPSPNLTPNLKKKVLQTRDALRLNDPGTCKKSRERFIRLYCQRIIPFEHLVSDAPFIAMELQRQNLVDEIRNIMIYTD